MTYSSKSRLLTDLPNVINELVNLNPNIVSSAFTLTAEDHNKLFICTNDSSIVITASDDLPDTFNALILCTKGPVMVTGLDPDGVLFENKLGGIHTAGSALTVKGLPSGTPWYAWVRGGTFRGVITEQLSESEEIEMFVSTNVSIAFNQVQAYTWVVRTNQQTDTEVQVPFHYVKGILPAESEEISMSVTTDVSIVLNKVA